MNVSLVLSLGIFLSFATLTQRAMAINKVIYGDDNRVFSELSSNSEYRTWAMSTAAMVPISKLRFPRPDDRHPESITIDDATLGDDLNLCPDQSFREALSPASCSGFLVEKEGEQFLVTAGHCMTSENYCEDNAWVFGFNNSSVNSETPYLPNSQVYRCKKIVEQVLNSSSENDYAVIKLDRKVENVVPLKFRTEGSVSKDIELVVIGHPSGLPSIVDDQGSVRDITNDFFFEANLDTFGGNSGSAVINAKTGVVEGILVRGERDYEHTTVDGVGSCKIVKTCEEGKCRGEDVTRITNISFLTGRPGPVETETEVEAESEESSDDEDSYTPPWEFDYTPFFSDVFQGVTV